MGFSWALEGSVKLRKADVAKYRAAVIDPSRWEWPESWGSPNERDAMTVAKVIDALARADATSIDWTAAGAKLAAVFSNDSHLWLDMRSHLLGLALVAGDHRGEATIAITGYLDGGPSEVYVATSKDGGAIDVLTARAAAKVTQQIYAAVEPLIAELAGAMNRAKTPDMPKSIAALHARVCTALRAADPAALTRAIAATKTFAQGSKGYESLEKLFPTAPALVDAIEHGWPKLDTPTAQELPSVALRALGALDAATARTLAKEALAIASNKKIKAYRDPLVAEAKAIATDLTNDADLAKAVAAMRRALPKAPHFKHHHQLERDPALRALREHPSPALRALAIRELESFRGTAIAPADEVYMYALSLVLEACATEEDWRYLYVIWTDSAGFELLDYGRVTKRDEGKAYMASLFGRDSKAYYAIDEQVRALHALFDRDPKTALAKATAFVAKKALSEPHAHALEMFFERLRREPAREAWTPVLEKASEGEGDMSNAALLTLGAWKERGAAARIVARLADGAFDVEEVCDVFEEAKDASAIAPLEKWASTLGKSQKREANRVKQCLSALAHS